MAVDREHIYHKRDRLRQFRIFCRAAKLKSMVRAADSLSITPSAVSRMVSELEYEMSAVLFERNRQKLLLTSAGKRLFELVESLVERMDNISGDFVYRLAESVSDRIFIGVTPATAEFVLPTYLGRFQTLYPDAQMRLVTSTESEALERLGNDEFDFVFGVNETSVKNSKRLEYYRVGDYSFVLVTALDHPLAARESVIPEEVAAYPAIAPIPGLYSRYAQQVVDQLFGFNSSVVIEVGRWGVIKRYVEEGLGISIVPSLCVREDDALSTIELNDHFPTRGYGVATRRRRYLTGSAQRLIQFMAPDYSP